MAITLTELLAMAPGERSIAPFPQLNLTKSRRRG